MALVRTTDPDDAGNCVKAGCGTLTNGRVVVAGQPVAFCPEHTDEDVPGGAEPESAAAPAKPKRKRGAGTE